MHDRMEGLYAATEYLGCFGDIGDIASDLGRKPLSYRVESILDALYGQSSIPDLLRCAPRAKQADT
jgi:hypothetical protein